MKLSQALKRSTQVEERPIAAMRAQLAYKHCPVCHVSMGEIEGYEVEVAGSIVGKLVTWSWESMWSLACDDHRPWIRAGYELEYTDRLEKDLAAFRKAYTLVKATIEKWDAIYRLTHDLYAKQLITEKDFIAETQALQASIHPELYVFPPDALDACLASIKEDGQGVADLLARATWKPPVTWT